MASQEGKILIATNKVASDVFEKSVIFIHTTDSTGSIGVMLNMRMDREMADKWSHEIGWMYPERIYLGGPMDRHMGYVLHSSDYSSENSYHLNSSLSYSGGVNVVNDINRGTGPLDFILVTGYCGWGKGQLQEEIDMGCWIVADFDNEFCFQNMTKEESWEEAIKLAAQKKTESVLDMVDS